MIRPFCFDFLLKSYRTWMPARLTTSAHFFMSLSMNWRNSSGELLTASEPLFLMVLMNSGDFTMVTTSPCILPSSGFGSLAGAIVGGLLIGLIETLWSGYFSIDYKDVASFSVLAIVLIFLPQGLFGRPDVEKV